MTLHETLKDKIKDAMRAKDAPTLEVYRGIVTAFVNDLVAKRKTPQEILDDDSALLVLKRLVKQRKDSIEQFTKGNRPELAEKETFELGIIETFLPALMTKEEIKKNAEKVLAGLGSVDKTKMGQLTGMVMKACGGNADGNDVKAVLEELLA